MKTPYILLIAGMLLLMSCGIARQMRTGNAPLLNNTTFQLNSISSDSSYAFSPNKPVEVGGVLVDEGPVNERRYLNALLGPGGETVYYERLGNCCAFTTKNSPINNMGLLDKYKVWHNGMQQGGYVILYINMYDHGVMRAPAGYTYRGYLAEDDKANKQETNP